MLFEQQDCEIPATWSQLATNVVVSKYFYGENGTPQRERSVRQLIHRVTRTIADWGVSDGYFASVEDGEQFYRDLSLAVPAPARFIQFSGLVQRRAASSVRCHGRPLQLALGPADGRGDSDGESLRVSAGLGLFHPERG